MSALRETPVVTCFLRHRGEILLLRRSDSAETYPGRWGGVSGYMEADDLQTDAWREIAEETGMEPEETRLVRQGNPLSVPDDELGVRWLVHPFLFDCRHRDVKLSSETAEAEWVPPPALFGRRTVPELWAAYGEVAPSVTSIIDDRTNGAGWLSIRALEVLRDWAARLHWQRERGKRLTEEQLRRTMHSLATRLVTARPAMAVIRNRVNRVMHTASGDLTALAEAAHAEIERSYAADDETARRAAQLVAGRTVLTFSNSATVIDALCLAKPAPEVYVAQSNPGGEGVTAAELLADCGREVHLLPDAAIAAAINKGVIDIAISGADTALPDGTVINKTGTALVALAAKQGGIPFYAACACDKISSDTNIRWDDEASGPIYSGSAALTEFNPMFEAVPADSIAGIVTEEGVLTPENIEEITENLRALAEW